MRKLNEENISKIADLRRKGYGYRSIAKSVGVSLDTAHKYGKNVQMEDDRRFGGSRGVKELVGEESRNLIGLSQIKPLHKEKFDRLISEEFDNAIKGLAQAFGLASNRFVGLLGFGRSLANIAFNAEESDAYSVVPIVKNLLFGEQKLPALPLRRKVFIRRIAQRVIMLKWDKIMERLKEEKS